MPPSKTNAKKESGRAKKADNEVCSSSFPLFRPTLEISNFLPHCRIGRILKLRKSKLRKKRMNGKLELKGLPRLK
jgi:hypothetical protein